MLLKKLNFAEDENHWKSKERELKFQIDKITKKSRKQKLELIEKIDRMRKNAAKDKKMDFYTSSLK